MQSYIKTAFTGSSLLIIDHSIADLSRRCLLYDMRGLSFREYLEFQGISFQPLSMHDILYDHMSIASEITGRIDVLPLFHKYLRHGFYPFYTTETETDYLIRVNNMITGVIDYDIPAVEKFRSDKGYPR